MIGKSLGKYRDCGLLIIRIGLGIAFIMHGWPKIKGGPDAWSKLGGVMPVPPAVVWGFLGAIIEFGGGILLIIGLLTRVTSFLLFLQMCVALFLFHLKRGDGFLAYSHALEDGIMFLGLVFLGPGKHSVDRE
jgi:putative oxidoreductase